MPLGNGKKFIKRLLVREGDELFRSQASLSQRWHHNSHSKIWNLPLLEHHFHFSLYIRLGPWIKEIWLLTKLPSNVQIRLEALHRLLGNSSNKRQSLDLVQQKNAWEVFFGLPRMPDSLGQVSSHIFRRRCPKLGLEWDANRKRPDTQGTLSLELPQTIVLCMARRTRASIGEHAPMPKDPYRYHSISPHTLQVHHYKQVYHQLPSLEKSSLSRNEPSVQLYWTQSDDIVHSVTKRISCSEDTVAYHHAHWLWYQPTTVLGNRVLLFDSDSDGQEA